MRFTMMKTALTILLFLAICAGSRAALVSSNLFTYASISTTNTSGNVVLGTVYLPSTTFSIQNGGLTATNALAVDFQMSFSPSNFTTVYTYIPAQTNAIIDSSVPPNGGLVTIYCQAVIRPTNTLSVGVSSIQQH